MHSIDWLSVETRETVRGYGYVPAGKKWFWCILNYILVKLKGLYRVKHRAKTQISLYRFKHRVKHRSAFLTS